jgi:hypothetical protein
MQKRKASAKLETLSDIYLEGRGITSTEAVVGDLVHLLYVLQTSRQGVKKFT